MKYALISYSWTSLANALLNLHKSEIVIALLFDIKSDAECTYRKLL